jgi:hypothetical protein
MIDYLQEKIIDYANQRGVPNECTYECEDLYKASQPS